MGRRILILNFGNLLKPMNNFVIVDQTPLHIAASVSNCREMAMTLMLNPNVQPHLTNNSKETAADIARRTGLTFPVFEIAHPAFADNVTRID